MSDQTLASHCEALFVSDLQSSQQPNASQVRAAIRRTLRLLGTGEVAALVAQEYGEHPDSFVMRMRWAREAVLRAYPRALA